MNAYFEYFEDEIEIRVESMKIEIDKVADSILKRCVKSSGINSALNQIDNLKVTPNSNDRSILESLQQIAVKISKINDETKERFFKNEKIIFKYNCGYIATHPHYMLNKFSKNVINLEIETTPCLTLLNNQKHLLFVDAKDCSLRVFDIEKKTWVNRILPMVNGKCLLQDPWTTCVNAFDEIIVFDQSQNLIFIFDKTYSLLRTFNINEDVTSMSCDPDKSNHLYIVDCQNIKLHLFDIESGVSLRNKTFDRLGEVKIKKDKVYVLCDTQYSWIQKKFSMFPTFVNETDFHIIEKTSFETLYLIKLDSLWLPRCLHVDDTGNMFVFAFFNRNEKDFWDFRHMIEVNLSGHIENSVCKHELSKFSDFIAKEDKLIFIAHSKLILIE